MKLYRVDEFFFMEQYAKVLFQYCNNDCDRKNKIKNYDYTILYTIIHIIHLSVAVFYKHSIIPHLCAMVVKS